MARKGARGRDVRGVVLLDKPRGLTSNRALQRVKRLYGATKAGHTGSLDPLATGMLPICLGAATRLSGYLLEARKTYAVTAELGVATDTGDMDGAVVGRSPAPPPPRERLLEALQSFVGRLEQVPPMYSALKRDGQRLYALARRGIVVERPARVVHVDALDLDAYDWPKLVFTVTCSKGTYVRSLVTDIAAALGTLGHVTALRRLGVEPFARRPMVSLEQLESVAAEGPESLDALLLPIDSPVADRPRITLPQSAAAALLHGRRLEADEGWPPGLVRLYREDGCFLGVGEVSPQGELASRRLFQV